MKNSATVRLDFLITYCNVFHKFDDLSKDILNKIVELENLKSDYENKMISELNISSDMVEYQKKLYLN